MYTTHMHRYLCWGSQQRERMQSVSSCRYTVRSAEGGSVCRSTLRHASLGLEPGAAGICNAVCMPPSLVIATSIVITINEPGSNAVITEINRLSTPGRRMYTGVDGIPRVKNGRGIVLISTSKGVMSGDAARKERLGGELICKVY